MARPSLFRLYPTLASLTAALREMSYPQFLVFKRYTFFNPPPLGRIYIVALYTILILILLFRNSIVSGPMYYETIAFRAAWCTIGQVPLIFLLSMKSSIVGFLVGSSHERLNWLHRTVARCLLITATIHFGFFWREWSVWHVVESEIQMMPIVKYGMGAWFTLIWIVISGFAPIRNLRYEFFVVQHFLSFTAFITLVMLHVPSYAQVYVWISIGFYVFDRTVRTLRSLYRNLSIFHRKSSGMLSYRAHLAAIPGPATRITIQNPPLRSWSPGQYVFLSFPSISPLQSHPFTIASSPLSRSPELVFIVRAHAGFSNRLYKRASSLLPTTAQTAQEMLFSVILDGPYGCPPNFLQYDTLVLIAGSTGATFTVPILLSTLQSRQPTCVRRIQFVWVVKSGSHFDWFSTDLTHARHLASDRGIDLELTCCVTCDSTYTANFPIRRSPHDKCCCCNKLVERPHATTTGGFDAKSINRSDSASSTAEFSATLNLCQSNCRSWMEQNPVDVSRCRPDLRAILDQNLRLAKGETGVAVCGPEGLMARTRSLVAELSDERGAEKGTGAYSVALFGEGFGW
jgi:FAD-binding domain/Ferric reductase NAD binding domain/Ferric reductase like transmembrane component